MDRSPRPAPIAIIGMGCRFPGAQNLDEYRRLLLEGRCAIEELPPHRFNQARYYDPTPGAYGKSYSRLGGWIPDTGFDPRPFRLPPQVVESSDPLHLWSLEVAKSTFEHAGLDPFSLSGTNTAVILGHSRGSMLISDIGFSTAIEGLLAEVDAIPALAALPASRREALRRAAVDLVHKRYPFRGEDGGPTTNTSFLAGLVNSVFGLTGRHMVVDAACASSFAALEIAARALRQGSVDLALSGGASYSQEMSMILFSQARALSADGSFPFDERANGFISSDGLGMVLLERLDDALRHGRRIHGILHGIGGACDGKGKGLWAPRKEGQILAIERAWARSAVKPEQVGLIEAHGTSTSLGDATEVEALTEFFGPRVRPGTKIPIGSVKSNLGHAREAAGVASLLKVLLAFEAEAIPPTIGYRKPGPGIDWNKTPLAPASQLTRWPRSSSPRIAGVDAFGIGGLDYHVVVEEPPSSDRAAQLLESAQALRPLQREPIALVGVGCVLPGARGAEDYWRLLSEGRSALSDAPDSRWSAAIYHQPGERTTWRTYTKRGGFVTGFEPDWRRYKIPPRLVEGTDPLQFMLLEAASDALSDAGVDLAKVDRRSIATTIGSVFGSDYALDLTLAMRVPEVGEAFEEALRAEGIEPALAAQAVDQLEAHLRRRLPTITEDSSGSSSSSTLASRISKTLDLMGATFTIDAACSSSLASLEVACESLWAGHSDMAVCGGGDRSMRVQRFEDYCQQNALSLSNRCAPFDAEADGFLPGEGAVVCVLKRLADAQAAGDRIYAVVRGVGSASDGERRSLVAPSSGGLATAMERAYASFGAEPRSVGYVECHGSGIPQADQAEIAAMRQVLVPGRDGVLLVGSVKSNLGHAQGAAGAAALVKAALALHHKRVPPTAGVRRPSPALGSELELVLGSRPLPSSRAAVSTMGMGGIHYHVVLEQAGAALPKAVPAHDQVCFLFPGQGSQYPGMLRELAQEVPQAKARLEEIDAILQRQGQEPLSRILWERTERMGEVLWTQLAVLGGDLMMLEAALAHGLQPGLVTGHSYGEYAALVAAGALSVEQAVKATLLRCEAIAAADRPGAMASVMTGRERLRELLEGLPGFATPSNVNGPEQIVVSGEPVAVDALLERCQRAGVTAVRLPVPRAFHSELMRPAAQVLARRIGEVSLRAPRLRCLSSVGAVERSNVTELREALVEQLTLPVDWVQQIECAYAAGFRKFVEVGPGSVLSRLAVKILHGRDAVAVALDDKKRPGKAGVEKALTALGAGATQGSRVLLRENPASAVEKPAEPGQPGVAKAALFSEAEWVELAASPRWEAFWETARPALAQMARSLFQSFGAGSGAGQPPAGRESKPGGGVKTFDATEVRRKRVAEEVRNGSFVLPARRAAASAAAPAPKAPAELAPTQTPAADGSLAETVRAFLLEQVTTTTGYPPELIDFEQDLEADLGIDTVKQAQIFGKVRERFDLAADKDLSLRDFPTLARVQGYVLGKLGSAAPAPPSAGAVATAPEAAAPTADPEASRLADIEAKLVELVCEQSGYPSELIGLDQDLEADLGIDTVKQAQIFGKVREIYDLKADKNLSLRDFPTLRHIAAYVGRGRSEAVRTKPSEPPSEVRAPMPEAEETTERLPAGRPELIGKLPMLRLRGTPFEMGLQHGLAQREAIQRIVETYKGFVGVEGLGREVLQSALAQPEDYFDAAALEEIRGIAEGAALPYRHVLAYNLDSALFPEYGTGCTQVGLAQEEHRSGSVRGVLHAVNEDSPLLLHLGEVVTRVIQVREPAGGRPHVLFSLAGQIGGPNGIGASGLTVTSCVLLDRNHAGGHARGLLHPVLIRKLVEEAESTAEAATIARNARRTGAWSMMLSHRSEKRVRVLEYDGAAFWESNERTRHLGSNHATLTEPTGAIPEHSRHRLERVHELVDGREKLEIEDMERILRDRFDRGRGREVQHRTMNTLCRVDNVMGLIVDVAESRLHVTDRVARNGEEPRWQQLRVSELFGASGSSAPSPALPSEGVRRIDVRTLPGESAPDAASLTTASAPEIMTRYVLRTAVTPLAAGPGATYRPARLVVVGDGPVARAVASRLTARGSSVTLLGLEDEPERLVDRFTAMVGHGPVPDVCLASALARAGEADPSLATAAWRTLRRRVLDGPYRVLQAWVRLLPTTDASATLSAVTALGGGLGVDSLVGMLPEGGGVLGLLKALRREVQGLRVKALDVDPSEKPEAAADALLAELDSSDGRLEVGLLRGQRRVLQLVPSPAAVDPVRLEELRSLRSVVLTGGARGITAGIALALARAGVRRLHLLGMTPLPPEVEQWRRLDDVGLQRLRHEVLERLRAMHGGKVTPVQWEEALEPVHKALEIDRTLRALSEAGAQADYHAVDVSDRDRLAEVLDRVRKASGPIEAIIHGAGYEKSRSFRSKSSAEFEATLGAKADGAVHLIGLTASDPLRLFLGFSSVSGRFGGLGQADYALASDLLARLGGALGSERPRLRAVTVCWPAWDEVGMAARKGTRALLEGSGQKFMGVEEGRVHFLREVLARDPEPEVVIAEQLPELDLDRLLPRPDDLERLRRVLHAASRLPLVDTVLECSDRRVLTECRLDAGRDAFLLQHRIGPTPILPAVVGLELLAETAELCLGHAPAALEDMRIETALKLAAGRRLAVRCDGRRDESGALEMALRTDFVGRGGRMLDPDRTLLTGRASARGEPIVVPTVHAIEGRHVAFQYPDAWEEDLKSVKVYHGPPLRGLVDVLVGTGGWHEARITAPPAGGLRPDRPQDRWWLAAPALDCCLQACGLVARARLSAMALPGGFGRVRVGRPPSAGERCRALIHKLSHEERRIHFDITLLGEDGAPILAVDDYVAHTFAPIGCAGGG
jgi:acyl transferase domain-containing protein/NAD(P)-dependent dehydrogenase (short-subunit alcohol dehydrogenase family)/acyl carrier protein